MAETRHTPGPWGLRGGKGMDLIAGPDGKALMSNERPSVELIANAMVICAAPELLEVLKSIEGRVLKSAACDEPGCSCRAELARVRAAIARAEGRHG